MFCYNCGKQINDDQKFCQFCGCKVNHNEIGYQSPNYKQNLSQQYSQSNQYNGQAVQSYNTSTPVPAGSYTNQPFFVAGISDKKIAVAAILAFFLGGFGAHRFYAGKIGSAIAMLLITIFGILLSVLVIGFVLIIITGIWSFIDFIIILCGSFKDAYGRYIKY